jgi:hypothetical protein
LDADLFLHLNRKYGNRNAYSRDKNSAGKAKKAGFLEQRFDDKWVKADRLAISD